MQDDEATHDHHIGPRDVTTWTTDFGRWLARVGLRLASWAGAHVALAITLGLGLGIALAATWGTGEVYDAVVQRNDLAVLDQPALDLAVSLRTPTLDTVVTAFTNVGGPVGMPILATLAVLVMSWQWRSWTPVVLVALAAAGSLAMTVAGKDLTGRTRPPLDLAVPPYETSPSFPSGHALNSVVVTGVVVYLVLLHLHRKRTRTTVVVAGLVFALAIGLSRVFLGHHWLTDVVAGWLLGLGWLAVVVTAHRLHLTVRRAGAPAAPAHQVNQTG
ncbi:MAG: phosphatase PAP2 family protein [Actinomycetota bacterium]|nr:phosphatase PAP2 family protein [Actinomycetota bacterium]